MMQTLVEGIEQFVAEVTKDVEEAIDAWVENSGFWMEEVETFIPLELEQRITEVLDPILEAYLGFEVSVEETVQPMVNTVEPLLNDHPVCMGCRHYHGQSYNGTMLVCGMHPYGWEGDKCPDWESFWQEPPTA
ncbi:MAG: hypothetical protein NW220_12115 [Leptolyngbyaceae cyanobacterium bins.349]|nr:hypothetical protein [Leptolyngbyaceae cyanobacterium bins.349]